jgi:hypothetical protein
MVRTTGDGSVASPAGTSGYAPAVILPTTEHIRPASGLGTKARRSF